MEQKIPKTAVPDHLRQIQKGATMIEYVLIISLISVAVIFIGSALGNKSFSMIKQTSTDIDNVSAPLHQ